MERHKIAQNFARWASLLQIDQGQPIYQWELNVTMPAKSNVQIVHLQENKRIAGHVKYLFS